MLFILWCYSFPDLTIFFWIAASADDAAAVNPNGAKTLVAKMV